MITLQKGGKAEKGRAVSSSPQGGPSDGEAGDSGRQTAGAAAPAPNHATTWEPGPRSLQSASVVSWRRPRLLIMCSGTAGDGAVAAPGPADRAEGADQSCFQLGRSVRPVRVLITLPVVGKYGGAIPCAIRLS